VASKNLEVGFEGKREFRITRTEAVRAVKAAVIQILKEKLDRRLEEELHGDRDEVFRICIRPPRPYRIHHR